jgi:hypothetical protein
MKPAERLRRSLGRYQAIYKQEKAERKRLSPRVPHIAQTKRFPKNAGQ